MKPEYPPAGGFEDFIFMTRQKTGKRSVLQSLLKVPEHTQINSQNHHKYKNNANNDAIPWRITYFFCDDAVTYLKAALLTLCIRNADIPVIDILDTVARSRSVALLDNRDIAFVSLGLSRHKPCNLMLMGPVCERHQAADTPFFCPAFKVFASVSSL
jgi:hypothetical protein